MLEGGEISMVGIDRMDEKGKVKTFEISVRGAAVIGDPITPQTWGENRIKNIFIYWMMMLILVSILNGTAMYAFIIVPDLFATHELRRIFLSPKYYYLVSILGVEAAMLLSCFYAFYILVFPDEAEWKIGNLRWIFFVIFDAFILFCLVMFVRETFGVSDRLERSMKRELRLEELLGPRLKASQEYFYCCGVHSHKDYKPLLQGSTKSFPHSCCNIWTNPACEGLESSGGFKDKIHAHGCLHAESVMTAVVSCIFLVLSAAFLLSSMGICMGMSLVLTYVGAKDMKIDQVNPFFD